MNNDIKKLENKISENIDNVKDEKINSDRERE